MKYLPEYPSCEKVTPTSACHELWNAVLVQGAKDGDVTFLKSKFCRQLCDLLDYDYDCLLELTNKKLMEV